jgi:putative transposase
MPIPSEKTLSIVMRVSQVIDEDKFRYEIFLLPIQEWIRQKLRVRAAV